MFNLQIKVKFGFKGKYVMMPIHIPLWVNS